MSSLDLWEESRGVLAALVRPGVSW